MNTIEYDTAKEEAVAEGEKSKPVGQSEEEMAAEEGEYTRHAVT